MAYSETDIDNLDDNLKTGVSRVEGFGRSQTNRTVAEELMIRNIAQAVVNNPAPSNPGGVPRRQYRVYSGKGW